MIECKFNPYSAEYRMLTMEIMPVSREVEDAVQAGMFPFFISHEYQRLYKLVREGQVAGALFEARDVVEVMLKFPTLLGLAFLEQSGEDESLSAVMKDMVKRELTLGVWKQIAYKVKRSLAKKDDGEIIAELLDIVLKFYSKSAVESWRNDMIGHGALPFEDDVDFIQSFVKLVIGMLQCLEESVAPYSEVEIFCDGKKIINLEDLTEDMGVELIVKIAGCRSIRMGNFVAGQRYFFDGFCYRILKSNCLDYIYGKKEDYDIELYREWYKQINNKAEISAGADAAVVKRGTEERLRSLNASEKYLEFRYLKGWLERQLDKPKGIFLLQMDRGMGKTAFVASIDPLLGKEDAFEDCCIRSYYCSELSYRSADEFVYNVNNLFKLSRERDEEIARCDFAELRLGDDGKRLAFVLGDILHKLQTVVPCMEKIMLVIDGLDEICPAEKSIFRFIPKEEDLPENVYILLTCRNEDSGRLEEFTVNEINKILTDKISSEDNWLNISLENENQREKYVNHLKKYMRKQFAASHINVKSGLFDEDFQSEIIEKCQSRFLYLKLAVDLLIEYEKMHMDYRLALDFTSVLATFLDYIERCFGKKLYEKAKRIIVIIASSFIPLTLEEICFLNECRETSIPMYVLAILKTFDSILMKIRTPHGTCYKMANADYIPVIMKRYEDSLKDLVGEWKNYILEVNYEGNPGYLDKSIYENRAEIYITANIYRYISEYVPETLGEQEEMSRLAKAIFDYENHMPAIQKGEQERYWDIDMSEAVIHILEDEKNSGLHYDKMVLAKAYNNYAYHYCVLPEALDKKEQIINYYDNAIREMENIESVQGEELLTLSRVYAGRGAIRSRAKESVESIEKDYLESYRLCVEAMEKGEEKASYSYLLSVIRVMGIYGIRKYEEAQAIFEEAKKELTDIKKRLGEKGLDALVYNTDRRIEFGILFEEAQFYRKMANIMREKGAEAEQVVKMFDNAEMCMENILHARITKEETDRVNRDRWVLIYEYGRYLYNTGQMERAEEKFDVAIEITDDLLQKEKLSYLGNRYLKELMQRGDHYGD